MHTVRGGFSAMVGAAALLLASTASAQEVPYDPAIDVQLFEYAIGPKSFLTVSSADLSAKNQFSVDFLVTFLTDPFTVYNVAEDEDTIISERTNVVESLLAGDITAAYGLTDRIQLGASLPLVFSIAGQGLEPATGRPAMDDLQASGFGDLRLEVKTKLWNLDRMRLAGTGGVTVPTSFGAGGSAFLGDDLPSLRGRLSFQWTNLDGKLSAGLNTGVILRKPREIYSSTIGQQFTWGAAGSYKFTDNFHGIAEVFGRTDGIDLDASPLELNGAVRVGATKTISVLIGGGAGLIKGIGSPGVRAFASVGWAPDYRDSDGDGVSNDKDRCPLVPEDRDDFEDADGCPDNDNDGDKREDSVDACPNQPEDLDGFEDEDGCPEIDNDKDGVNDLEDRCPLDPEDGKPPYEADGCPADRRDSDADGVMDAFDECPEGEEDLDEFDDWDGCPDPDNDGDGIPDETDECPLCAEDMDDFFDGDGCPEADNDKDGLLDGQDNCPDEPETINGIDDFDGCPDDGGAELVRLEGDLVVFDRPPLFERTGGLKKQGQVIVDQAALVMLMHREVTSWTVLISAPKYYDERAAAVRERLIERGIPEGRVSVMANQAGEERIGVLVSQRSDVDPDSPEAMCTADMQVQSRPRPAPTEAATPPGPEAVAPDPIVEAPAPLTVPDELVALEGVSTTIAFGRNTAVMTGKSKKALDAIAELLIANPHVMLEVGAHTDSRKGKDKSAEITQAQADKAVEYLSSKGVDIGQLIAVGYGMDVPIGDNNQSAGRSRNRRIELKFSVR